MKKIIHKSNTRGHANHGWLNSYHTFSFANYYDPQRMNFGVLRVLNDDTVAPGMGFGKHPHDNMEIISIPLSGDLEHEDSMGNKKVIKEGDIQSMTAGTGVVHSEYNRNKDKEVKFLQIWVMPKKRNVTPRYDQISLQLKDRKNKLQQIVSPDMDDEGVSINQDAWFNITEMEAKKSLTYQLHHAKNGLYAFVLAGDVTINGEKLNQRDGMGIREASEIAITADTNAKVLLMEVPMA
ncbi:pirin family protein [Galbibacter pacificus]|uniref:Pirin family protein n=1 Tax=Galbibacter pacificus TaxID=2996052 RepID=A0ABT6FLY8_9FLAO|nr:pirin family protein [Galbibacter pacificus]MDG3580801.1 pirin family protein [Galbibacter pacificus]MDG3584279.1 pirin family protein [Galbibacter pacificus]